MSFTKTLQAVLIVLLISQIVACKNTGADGAGASVDTLAIIKNYNSNHRMYPIFLKKMGDSLQLKLANYHISTPTLEEGLENLKWAKESIDSFRAENARTKKLYASQDTLLNAYFITINDIDSLRNACHQSLSGIRLYFGKNLRDGAIEGQYTHFIFPTTYDPNTRTHNDMIDYGFVEQIKPCPSGECSTRDILQVLP